MLEIVESTAGKVITKSEPTPVYQNRKEPDFQTPRIQIRKLTQKENFSTKVLTF